MKIAVIAFEWPSDQRRTGGVSHFNYRLCCMLAKLGHDVTAYTLQEDPAMQVEAGFRVVNAVSGHRGGRHGRFYRYYAAPLQARKLKFDGCDLVLSSGDDWAMRRPRVPWIRLMHGSAWRELRHNRRWLRKLNLGFLYALETWSMLRSDRTLYNSTDTKKLYPHRRQDRIVHLPVDTRMFHPGVKENVPTLLFVGELDSRKRGRWLLEMFVNRVRPAMPQAQLWMVCEPGEPYDGVTYIQHVTLEQLADLYRRAQVFCMPSSYEGYGIPYMEAMASGTLVVTTPNPGAEELLRQGRYGWIVSDSELPSALIEALLEPRDHAMWTNPALLWAREHEWEVLLPAFLAGGASPSDAPLAVNEGQS